MGAGGPAVGQLGRVQRGTSRATVPGVFAVGDSDAADRRHRTRREHHRDLRAQLVRHPGVVVVAEGDQFAGRRQDAAIAGARQPGQSAVGEHAHPPVVSPLGYLVPYRRLIEDDDDVDLARIVLVEDRVDGLPEQLRPVASGDDGGDSGGRGGVVTAARLGHRLTPALVVRRRGRLRRAGRYDHPPQASRGEGARAA